MGEEQLPQAEKDERDEYLKAEEELRKVLGTLPFLGPRMDVELRSRLSTVEGVRAMTEYLRTLGALVAVKQQELEELHGVADTTEEYVKAEGVLREVVGRMPAPGLRTWNYLTSKSLSTVAGMQALTEHLHLVQTTMAGRLADLDELRDREAEVSEKLEKIEAGLKAMADLSRMAMDL